MTEEVFPVRPEVEKVLESIRPHLQADGGDVELVDVEGGVVKVRLLGACGGCPMATMTLKGGIEAVLKERIPAVLRVESV
jgi:Fe-S cluster biogenesis protein NfuA